MMRPGGSALFYSIMTLVPHFAGLRRSPNKRDAQRIEKLQAKMPEVAGAVDAMLLIPHMLDAFMAGG